MGGKWAVRVKRDAPRDLEGAQETGGGGQLRANSVERAESVVSRSVFLVKEGHPILHQTT